ncbi:RNF115_126 [Mytilus edulis]|uniref:RING-type E3 ubiquitin transferase n=1 Tax=Mytilus edulis TaxID=6550 RepID=A0A8S3UXI3_MYTED|nr:RNF115_126 [Mytilus edulis]
MAEAAVNTLPVSKFYCHSCSEEINPKLPDYTCPKCENGFIEEITESEESPNNSSPQEIIDPASNFAEIWGRAFLENFQQQVSGVSQDRPQRSSNSEDRTESDSEDTDTDHPSVMRRNGPVPFTRIQLRTRNNQQSQNPRQVPYLQGLLQMFIDRLSDAHGPALNFIPMMHGNPGDYAWGVHGLDNIVTQLLNQLEGSGPAPAEKSKIDSLPSIKITPKLVDKGAHCAICFEDFSLDEEVKRLPCDHYYHNDCIVKWLEMVIKWLEMHGTCPVCRKDLNGVDSSLQDNYPNPVDIFDSNLATSQNNNTEEDDDS